MLCIKIETNIKNLSIETLYTSSKVFLHKKNKVEGGVLKLKKNKSERYLFALVKDLKCGDVVMIDGKHYLVDVVIESKPQAGEIIKGVALLTISHYKIIKVLKSLDDELFLVLAEEIDKTTFRDWQIKKLLTK